jgi:chitodextrinase
MAQLISLLKNNITNFMHSYIQASNTFFIVLLLVLLPKFLNAQDVYEPNDSTGATTIITAGTYTNLSIHQIGDVDWYRITATKNGLLHVKLTFLVGSGTSDVELELYAANGTTLLSSSTTGDTRENITYPIVSGTNYFIKVYGAGGENVINNYDMSIFELDPDGKEVNETVTTATLLSPGTYSDLNIFSTTDIDYYRIHISADTLLTAEINLHPGNSNHDLDLYVYNAVSDGLGGFTLGSLIGKSETSTYIEQVKKQVALGDYFIKVIGDSGSTNVYSLRLSVFQGPPLPALELASGETTILGTDPRMQAVLNSASAGGLTCTANLTVAQQFSVGPTDVNWSVWAGAANSSTLLETGTTYILVLPYGQTPVGVSGPVDDTFDNNGDLVDDNYSRAVGGNNSTGIVRDASGGLHIAWFDGEIGRPYRIWYRRGTQNATTGETTWTAAVDVANGLAEYRSFVALAVSTNAVHFAWSTSGTFSAVAKADYIMYRRLVNTSGIWAFDAIVNTGLRGYSHDNGCDIAAFTDDEVHIVARNRDNLTNFDYGYRLAGSSTWLKESFNVASIGAVGYKYPAITVDHRGDVHVVFTALIRNGNNYPQIANATSYYWNAWYLHRPRPTIATPGTWAESHNALATYPAWQDHESNGQQFRDIAADWFDIQTDYDGNIYMAWHGTANNFCVGKDDAFITRRTFAYDGLNSGFESPQALFVVSNSPNSLGYSWAPSICADKNNMVFPVFFYKKNGIPGFMNYADMDSGYRILRNGIFVDGGTKPLSKMADLNVTTGFADTTPHLYRHSNGKAWLDVLQGMLPNTSELSIIVYQREEVTSYLAPYITSNPASISVTEGQTASFSVTAVGATITAYQWYKNNILIGGANSSSYTTPATVLADNTATFSVTITNITGTATSTNGVLTVNAPAGDSTPPSVPSGLTSSAITQTTLTLSWVASTDAVGVTGYTVYKDGVSIGTTASTSLAITDLTAATTYIFTVSAFDAANNNSAVSSGLSATTLTASDITAPSAPTTLVATSITHSTFTLSWTASSDNIAVTGYTIFQNGISIGTSTTTSYSVSNLNAITTYIYTVLAFDAATNNSAVSNSLSVTTLAATDSTAPTVPNQLIASAITQTSFTVSWAASTDAVGVTGYKIFKNSVLLGTTNTTNYALPGLTANTVYSIQVSAYDAANNSSSLSNALSVTTLAAPATPDTIAPTVPTELLASSITLTSFTISWKASTDVIGVAGYKIYNNNALLISTNKTNFAITGLSIAENCLISVLAYDDAGNESAKSATLSVTTLTQVDTTAPNAPTNLSAPVISGDSVSLTWSAATDDSGVTTYTVFQNGEAIGTTALTTYEIKLLQASTTYSYTVKANDAAGNNSQSSGTLTITTASASTTNDSSSSDAGGGGGGCSYAPNMPINEQLGNLFAFLLFSLFLFKVKIPKRQIKN